MRRCGILLLSVLFSTRAAEPAPVIRAIATDPSSLVARFERFEVTFQVDTTAENLHFPYDVSPPPGIPPETGISVDVQFTPDNWQTVHTIPAFYYQKFLDEIRSGREWFYPTSNFCWKARFSPPSEGAWQYRIVAQDKSGASQSGVGTFSVASSSRKGFIRVSRNDSRYFEFDDGAYFPGLGYNMNYDHVSWRNPVLDNEDNFRIMQQNGIQLVRIWLSQWAIFGSEWNPWSAQAPALHGLELPYTGISSEEALPSSEVSMKIEWDYSPCMFIGVWKAPPAVKRETRYRVRILYKTKGLSGPRIPGKPYGFLAKTGDWLWGPGNFCHDPGSGSPVTTYQPANTPRWEVLEGTLNTGQRDFLTNFFLVLENVSSGAAYVDYVWIQEDLGGGRLGPNIVSKPWMAHHQYFEQRNSYAFDKVLKLAADYDIYLRLVLHEKNDRLLSAFDYLGHPAKPDNNWFYGNYRSKTKSRWLLEAFWRYAQARWGYSPHVHSWELLNEGDPWNGRHYALADEFGKYMHCRVFGESVEQFAGARCSLDHPNDHMVSTSFWHSWPRSEFWTSVEYPNVDFADIHKYIAEDTDPAKFFDTALATQEESARFGATQMEGAGKPVIRGETGLVSSGSGPASNKVLGDRAGVWLHNFIWGGINPGGMIESYWYESAHIYNSAFDYRQEFGRFYKFIRNIPLNNGRYQDAAAIVSNPYLRAWGQKDLTSGRAHLWVQNRRHSWEDASHGRSIPPQSGTVTLAGFAPNRCFIIDWWDTYQVEPGRNVIRKDVVSSQPDGSIVIPIVDLSSDLAVKISASDRGRGPMKSCAAGGRR